MGLSKLYCCGFWIRIWLRGFNWGWVLVVGCGFKLGVSNVGESGSGDNECSNLLIS